MKSINLWRVFKKNMKLPKKELNRYHFALQKCIRSRKEWITYYTIRIRWKKLRQKVSYHMIWNNPIVGIFLWTLNLPSSMLKFLDMQKLKYELKETETEIKVLQDEMIYVDQIRWNQDEEKKLKLLDEK